MTPEIKEKRCTVMVTRRHKGSAFSRQCCSDKMLINDGTFDEIIPEWCRQHQRKRPDQSKVFSVKG